MWAQVAIARDDVKDFVSVVVYEDDGQLTVFARVGIGDVLVRLCVITVRVFRYAGVNRLSILGGLRVRSSAQRFTRVFYYPRLSVSNYKLAIYSMVGDEMVVRRRAKRPGAFIGRLLDSICSIVFTPDNFARHGS